MYRSRDFVYVNQDGSVRELSPDEHDYLSQAYQFGDGNRPYIKTSYTSQDGSGSQSGFLPRRSVPRSRVVEPVNPHYVPPHYDFLSEMIEDSKRVGDIATDLPDGAMSFAPNPNIPLKERSEKLRELQLGRQRERETLARHPDYAHADRQMT